MADYTELRKLAERAQCCRANSLREDIARVKSQKVKIVCLCGSTRFYEAFQEANFHETLAGHIVLSVGFYPHTRSAHNYLEHGEHVGITQAQKEALDELHKRKIDLAHEIFVLNVGGYIGDSTRSEIHYAVAHNKSVRYLEALSPQPDNTDGESNG